MGFASAVLVVAGGATVAFAADPRPDNARGAVVTVSPNKVPVGGTVVFTGTGFSAGEAVCVKIDDGNIANANKAEVDTFGRITAAPDGSLQGTVDLAKVNAETPVGAGAHWLRFLSGPGTCIEGVSNAARSLHATFTVAAPVPLATPTPAPTPTLAPGQTPPPPTPAPTATPAPPPERVVGGTVVVTLTALKLAKKTTVEVSLKAGARGSAGKVRIITKKKFKIGKAKKKQQVLFKADSYLVEPVSTGKIKLKLTNEGKTLFRTKTSIDAIVEIRDASGESDVDQPVVIRR